MHRFLQFAVLVVSSLLFTGSSCDTDDTPTAPGFESSSKSVLLICNGEDLTSVKGSVRADQASSNPQKLRANTQANGGTKYTVKATGNTDITVVDQFGAGFNPGQVMMLFSSHTAAGFKSYIEVRFKAGTADEEKFYIPVIAFDVNTFHGQLTLKIRGTSSRIVNGNIGVVSPGSILDVIGLNGLGDSSTGATVSVTGGTVTLRDANDATTTGTAWSFRVDSTSGQLNVTVSKTWADTGATSISIRLDIETIARPTGNTVNWVARYDATANKTVITGRVPTSFTGSTLTFAIGGTLFTNRPDDTRSVNSDGYVAPVEFGENRASGNRNYTVTVRPSQGLDTAAQGVSAP